jgi:CubicO group peptidase (beta-lactamase class C family)
LEFGQVRSSSGNEPATPIRRDTRFQAASLSKPVFASLVMSLTTEGLFDLEQPIHQLIDEPALSEDPRWHRITARHVLSHQTGLPNWRDVPGGPMRLAFEPGTGWRYSGEGYELLARALAARLGTDAAGLEALFQQRLAQPLRMAHSRFWVPGQTAFGSAYALQTTASDYAQWMAGLLQPGVLPPTTLDAFFARQPGVVPDDPQQRALGLAGWALGFSVYEIPGAGTLHVHGGANPGYTSLAVLSRDRGWGFVLLTNGDQAAPLMIDVFRWLM